MNFAKRGSQWLADKIEEQVSDLLVYSRGSLAVPIAMSRNKTTYEVSDLNGVLIQVDSYDFVFKSELLVFDSVKETPQPGDRITETIDGNLHAYEVKPIGYPQEQYYRPCDPFGHQIRVHTTYLGVVDQA